MTTAYRGVTGGGKLALWRQERQTSWAAIGDNEALDVK